MMGLAASALVLSGYLGWHSIVGRAVVGCGGGSPCDQVLNSRWSVFAGDLPVSGLAAGGYLAMLIALCFLGPTAPVPVRRLAWQAVLVLAGAAAGSAVWFTGLQAWGLGAWCPYCLSAHLLALSMAILAVWHAPGHMPAESAQIAPAPPQVGSQTPDFRPGSVWGWSLLGVALAGLLAASQLVFPPAARYLAGSSATPSPSLDPRTVPLMGDPAARCVVAVLFDYQCPHCQRLHFLLDETARSSAGQLAFALYPTPLSPRCNPYVPREVEAFRDSCELARVGLAVWKADPREFVDFERWMFTYESGDHWQPRRLEAAVDRARALVGPAKFAAAQADPWIGQYLQAALRIYAGTVQGGNTAVPKLVFGTRWVVPEAATAAELAALLQERLGLPPPGSRGLPTEGR